MRALLLTLGHNSSAILIEDNQLVWGYETERLTGIKSDSQFPRPILDKYLEGKPDIVYVSHWAPTGNVNDMSKKHWDPGYFEGIPIVSVNTQITHHDTHAAAALLFANTGDMMSGRTNILVIDGFGTCGEHISIYDAVTKECQYRVHGYNTSLGLWYQYATAWLGMKMHEDEYKILGYEVHCPVELMPIITLAAQEFAQEWIKDVRTSIYGSKYDPLYNLNALTAVRELVFTELNEAAEALKVKDQTTHEGRSIMGAYIQQVLEQCVMQVLDEYTAKFGQLNNLICTGGVFYNVKLGKLMLDCVPGKVCVFPLAGDQGNALGLYAIHNQEFTFPDDLNWGKRSLYNIGEVPNMHFVTEAEAVELGAKLLNEHGFFNLVRGNMEFGPRAMCNTSTIAQPFKSIVALINDANDRNTVMPMAPVMDESFYKENMVGWPRVHKSEQFMIMAMAYRESSLKLAGVQHTYVWPYDHCTGRPQVIYDLDPVMTPLLDQFGPLINTSFNFHGRPIAFEMPHVIDNHMEQYKRNQSFHTLVITNA